MKTNIKRLLSFSASDSEFLNDSEKKIELVNCPNNDSICKVHLSVINKCYVESEQHRREKNFQLSIETLKEAFYKTTELNEQKCLNCAVLFRKTINESLENIHGELEKITTGLFGNKRYKSNLLLAKNILNDFNNVMIYKSVKIPQSIKINSEKEVQNK